MMVRSVVYGVCVSVCLLGAVACDRAGAPEEASVSEPEPAAAKPLDGSSAQPASQGQVDPGKRAQIEGLLGGVEHVPTAQDLYAVEPDVDALRATLLDIYQDSGVKKGTRQRALVLMQHAPGPVTNAFYEGKLTDPATPSTERRILVKAYAGAAGPDAEAVLIEQLAHDDTPTRVMVIQELAKLGSPGAIAALEARAKIEQTAHVRKKLGTALGRDIGASPATTPQQEVK